MEGDAAMTFLEMLDQLAARRRATPDAGAHEKLWMGLGPRPPERDAATPNMMAGGAEEPAEIEEEEEEQDEDEAEEGKKKKKKAGKARAQRGGEVTTRQGICYIVGAGPGDPGLMTVRGAECLREAEIVFYDHLVSREILAEVPPLATLVYVGKHRGEHEMSQEELNRQLCEAVRSGRVVVRLKGGDPFMLGRGGEEAVALHEEKLPFEVIPGVTSGVAAAAYAGIPLTHRKLSSGVTMVTGHEAEKESRQVDWRALGALKHTLCIYMGMKHLRRICEELIAGGRSPEEPAAIVQSATLPAQRCIAGTLADLPEMAEREQIRPPAVIIVGPVVALRTSCAWFIPPTRQPGGTA